MQTVNRVAALYDIHGNVPALRAVLREINLIEPDLIVVGGDVPWGPEPRVVMEELLRTDGRFFWIRGNTDRWIAGAGGRAPDCPEQYSHMATWCRHRLTPEQLQFLAGLPDHTVVQVDGLGPVRFVHGSPRRDDEAMSHHAPAAELAPMVDGVEEGIIVCGHTHVQFERNVCGKRIINPGSVGQANDSTTACWAVLDSDVHFRTTVY